MKLLASSGVKSARTYESGGRKRFVGTRHLKQSESLVFQFGIWNILEHVTPTTKIVVVK